MSERLPGRCDCGHRTYLLDHSEWCPCEDCHPGGRLYREDASGASGDRRARRTLRRAPRGALGCGSVPGSGTHERRGPEVEARPPFDPEADAEVRLGLTVETDSEEVW